MKKNLLFSLLFGFFAAFSLQNIQAQSTELSILPSPRKFYLGFGTGINNYTGIIGINGELTATNNIGIFGTLGLGSWGGKMGIGARYYFNDARGGSAVSVGISNAGGLEDFVSEQEVITPIGGTATEEVTMDLNSIPCLNIAYVFAKNLRDKNKILFSVGYSSRLKTNDTYIVTSGHTLSETSLSVMNVLRPGGILLGIDFMFGVGR